MLSQVGVIGLGAMGINHVRVFADLGTPPLLVADPDEARGRMVEKRFGTTWVPSPDNVLNDPRIKMVTIAAPTRFHYDLARRALESGKHVLVEKPICETTQQAEDLVQLAHKLGLTLAVGQIERHNPAVRAARNLIDTGAVGDTLAAVSRRVSGGGSRIHDVGVILDLAIHDIDVARYLLGGEAVGVYCAAGEGSEIPGREDRAHIVVDFDNGAFATLEANWRSPVKVRRMSLTCSKGNLDIDYQTQSIERSTSSLLAPDDANLYNVPREYEVHRIAVQNQEPLKNELRDFLRACETGTPPLVGGEDGLANLRVARAALLSARERRRVTIEEVSRS